ncbi:MAG: flavodoxin family protein [Synergistaceae bacterium]|jgi:multimeric flavodoxin WrbA|nr:flavodoxin family protein [Synergistaceae bacterium]
MTGSKKPVRVVAVNGSPRKNWNTHTLLRHALDGAKSVGAEADEIVNLYALSYRGCASCFNCKLKGVEHGGKCAIRDDLTEVLDRIMASDMLLLGSPVFLGDVTGGMRSFIERLVFMNLAYRHEDRSYFKGRISTGFIYTMNRSVERMKSAGYEYLFKNFTEYLAFLNGTTEYMTVHETYQFDDYSKYEYSLCDPVERGRLRDERFPADCGRAFEMGARLAKS